MSAEEYVTTTWGSLFFVRELQVELFSEIEEKSTSLKTSRISLGSFRKYSICSGLQFFLIDLFWESNYSNSLTQ